ncbi:UDP-N-acetylmuramoylalanine--D-glutamate ligase [Clostridiaceae bacterium JG1575]|nr:UDP-N-acetylmuramoylalanine--D-glutamate ligase [Clostridiaceae bacterium JG1575]
MYRRDFARFRAEIRDQKVAVLGIGVSNLPLLRFLLQMGAKVSAFDRREEAELPEVVEEFKDSVALSLGPMYLRSLAQGSFDVIFRTPGLRPDVPELLAAQAKGARITSEMEEFMRHCPARIIGITGSDGKSTTTTMIHGLLEAQGVNAWIGGNIGHPLFSEIESIAKEDVVVVELSSFQLMDMDVSADVAVVTNLSENHLDVHKDMQEYTEAKKNIFRFQDAGARVILNKDNAITRSFAKEAVGEVSFFSSKGKAEAYYADDVIYLGDVPVCRLSEMKVRGVHNAENFCAALLATKDYVSIPTAHEYARTFMGVRHRAQLVGQKRGVRYYNDSIASSPTRTLATVRSFQQDRGRIIILLGGRDKKLDFQPLAEEAGSWFRHVILMGEAKEKIRRALLAYGGDAGEGLLEAEDMEEAVALAYKIARPGDVVLLSPGCTSFDRYRNFEERGDLFARLVGELPE